MDASLGPLRDISHTFNEYNEVKMTENEVTLITNFVAKNAMAFRGPAIVKRKQSKLPYTIAYTPETNKIFVLFKKQGPILGQGANSIVTTAFSLSSQATVAAKIGFRECFTENEFKINQFLSKKDLKDLFVVTEDFFMYNYFPKLDGNRKIKTLKPNATPLGKSLSCDNHTINPEALVSSLQKVVGVFERLDVDLYELLKTRTLSLKDKVSIASSLAHRLRILHTYGIVHLDIKPENIMMSDLIPKIGDFGFATALGKMAKPNGTQKFMALEVLIQRIRWGCLENRSSDKYINVEVFLQNEPFVNYLKSLPDFVAYPTADIWSFGLTLLSIIDLDAFYEFPFNDLDFVNQPDVYIAKMLSFIEEKQNNLDFSEKEQEQLKSLFKLIALCLKTKPSERINLDQVFIQLEIIGNKLNELSLSSSEEDSSFC